MSYTHAWDNSYPPGSTSAGLISQTFRNTKVDIAERLQDLFGMPDFTSDPLKPNYVRVGYGTSAKGGSVRITDDTGTYRWLAGLNASAGTKYYTIRDAVNDVDRLTIDPTTGAVSVGYIASTIGTFSGKLQNVVPSGYATDTVIFWVGINGVTNGLQVTTDPSNNIAYTFQTKTGAYALIINALGNAIFSGQTLVSTNVANDYAVEIINASTTGYGLFIRNGLDSQQSLVINNAASTVTTFSVYGYGKVVIAPQGNINGLVVTASGTTYAATFQNTSAAGTSYGVTIAAGGNASDIALRVAERTDTTVYFYVRGDGQVFAPIGLTAQTLAVPGNYTSASGNITLTNGTVQAKHFIKA